LFGSLVTLELTVLIIDKHHIWPLGTSLTSSNRIEIKLEKPKVELPLKSLQLNFEEIYQFRQKCLNKL